MTRQTEYQLAQLEALGTVDVRIMHKSVRTDERWIGVGVHGLEIGGDGLLRTVSGHGSSVDEAIDNLYEQITNLPEGLYLIRNGWRDSREAFRFDHDFGSWLRVEEKVRT